MDLVTIVTVILLLSASALCIALIFYFSRVTKSLEGMHTQLKQLSSETGPLISSSRILVDKLNRVADEIEEQTEISKKVVKRVKNEIDEIIELEATFRRGLEGPLNSLLKNLAAINNGINTFWSTYRKK